MQAYVKRALLVIALAAIGGGVSVAIDVIHTRLAADHAYASFCNVSSRVNCDVVLTSRYAELSGIAISRLAIGFYLISVAIAIGVARARRASTRETAATIGVVWQVWGLLFSGYLAFIAFAVLQTVCLMCGALYLINIASFGAAWWLRSAVRFTGHRQRGQSGRMDRLVLGGSAVALALVALIGAWEAFGRGRQGRSQDPAEIARQRPDFYQWFFQQPVLSVPIDGAHSLGDPNAPVTVVEFSDFECGHCSKFHKTLENFLRASGRSVRVIFRHFPLDASCNPTVSTRLHQRACLAATAAECAAEQGKFWQYHDLLFGNQDALGREYLIAYADRLGLDGPRFAACLGGDAARERVARDARAGAELGIDSTPTVFINGRRIKGALDLDQLADASVLAQLTP
jgi:protein-disulfide isomerase/uncharacterized membrane protein